MPPHRDATGSSRPWPRILMIAAGALLIARVGTGIWEDQHPSAPVERPGQAAGKELVQWQPLAIAESASRALNKPILYDFSAEWCGPCKLMSAEVFADAKAADQINTRFVPVRIVDRTHEDGQNVPEVQTLQDRFKIDAFPTIVVYSPATGRHESMTGYGGREGMLEELTQALAAVNRPASPDSAQ